MSINVEVKLNLGGVFAALDQLQSDIGERAAVSAVNKTLAKARTNMIRAISREFNVTAGYVRERLRIEGARPAWGKELDDSILPAEAGLDETHVSFTKGCYPGQEPIARLRYRGKVNRSLRVLEVEGADPGDEIRHGDKVVGRVTSVVDDRALAYVRVEVPAEAEISVGGKTGRTLSP